MGVAIGRLGQLPDRMASKPESRRAFGLPSTAELLTTGGDIRIVRDPAHGLNRYGCPPIPEPEVLAYGSATASIISPEGFSAAERLRLRLLRAARIESAPATYARELDRIRMEFIDLNGLAGLRGLDIIFAASGTDVHLFAAQLAAGGEAAPLLAVMVEANETGSGVFAALGGRHFSARTALGSEVQPGNPIAAAIAIEVATITSRAADGSLRSATTVDAEVEALVADAAATGRRVLLTLVDVSKTGMIVPSPACALAMQRRFPTTVDILVDACQFRLAAPTLRAYLEHGFWVALTGSKFLGGPAFAGALLLPHAAARRLRQKSVPAALGAYSTRADWPQGWTARNLLAADANCGLLLRWQAAIEELRAFRSLPEPAITSFLEAFAAAVGKRLTTDPAFEPLAIPRLDRHAVAARKTWDDNQTIFSFRLRRPGADGQGTPLSCEETAQVYELLGRRLSNHQYFDPATSVIAGRRCHVGQPVAVGVRQGVPLSALRLCASARLVVDAVSPLGRGSKVVIAEALSVFDKAALLARELDRLPALNPS